jgi:hypothetical protein
VRGRADGDCREVRGAAVNGRRLALLALSLAVVAGCSTNLPKPNTPATAAVELDVAYGIAAHELNRYLAYPVCTAPLTVVPCKRIDVQSRIKAADAKAWDAKEAARTELATLGPGSTRVDQIMAATRSAISLLASLIPTKEASQ